MRQDILAAYSAGNSKGSIMAVAISGTEVDDIGVNHPVYDSKVKNWKLCDDMVESENQESYLIELFPEDTSKDNKQRNKDYKERASWLGVSGFTLAGLIGTAYEKSPIIKMPSQLDYMEKNVDGSNVSLDQQIQSTTREVLKAGRAGLFTTFPDTEGEPISVADMDALKFVPTIHMIKAERIVNWDTMQIGAEVVLSLVVFTDSHVVREKYKHVITPTRRELALEQTEFGLVFVDSTWMQNEKKEWVMMGEPNVPSRGDGTVWDRIPFTFVGAVDNNAHADKAPMLDVCTKNRDHFRNSADQEESVFFCGQAQPWASGLDIDTFKAMKKDGLYLGSRRLLGLPDDATFEYANAEANSAVRQAMIDKVEEMAMIGARLLKQGTVAKTAAQANNETAVQHSILSLAVENVATAYVMALDWAAIYQNQAPNVTVEPDKGFMTTPITAEDLKAFAGLVLQGVLTPLEQYRYLTKHDIADPEISFEDRQEALDVLNSDIGIGEE